jgi:fido (protein-threonine AMPylation protein)
MYIEKKKIGDKEYYYAKISVRVGNKVRTKTIGYLGLGTMSKKDLDKAMAKISKKEIESGKKKLKEVLQSRAQYLSNKQQKRLKEIKKLWKQRITCPDKALISDMFKDFKTSYIYNTNAIEGNTLTLKETNLLLNENRSPAGKDLREVYDHLNASVVFDHLLKYKSEITKETIMEIHRMLLDKIDVRKGKFRLHNVRIIGSRFETSDAKYVETDMRLLFQWYKKNKQRFDPLAFAAIFHEKFERVHPFYDGNGRTGRMLLNLMLLRANYPPLIIKNKGRKKYYDALNSGHRCGLFDTETIYYTDIVDFCYGQLIKTWEEIFVRWG